MMPLVSIIIPSFNSARTIEETLWSACGQTWANLEVILVDDGSSDGTAEIGEAFGFERLRVVRQENQGACAARNHGISLAKGEFFQFLDADDILSLNKIADQVRRLISLPSRYVAHGPWDYIDASGKVSRGGARSGRDYSPGLEMLLSCFELGFFVPPHSWLVAREVLEEAGEWDTRLTQNQDGEYFSRILENAEGAVWVDTAMCYYRRHVTDSVSQSRGDMADQSLMLAADLIAQRMIRSGRRGRELAGAVFLRTLCRVEVESRIRGLLWEKALANGLPSRRIQCGGQCFRCVYRIFGWKSAFSVRRAVLRLLRRIGISRRR